MKLLIFGASGLTGLELVKQGLNAGYIITAFVRNPSVFPITHKNLHLIQGNVLVAESVESAMKDQDAVLVTLGVKPNSPHISTVSEGTRNIIRGMEKYHIKRLIVQSAFGVGDSYKRASIIHKIIYNTVLKPIWADKLLQEKIVKESALDWIIVRPTTLTNGSVTGKYQYGVKVKISLTSHISRADVANFMLKQTTDTPFLQKAVLVSY